MSDPKDALPIRFLLVEDDHDHAFIVKKTIERERIMNSVVHAENGAEAWEMLSRQGEHADTPLPDIIILDIKMPVMNGHELLAKIREDDRLRRIPVVMMTTSESERDREMAYSQHVNSYLVKPLDFEKFRQLVKDLSLYWGVWNWNPPSGDLTRE